MLNLVYHKVDFGLDASWSFSATGHGKGANDGLGALLKSTARCATLSKSFLLSSPKDFYEFSKKNQMEKAMATGKTDPSVYIYYLEAIDIERTKTRVLQARFSQLNSASRVLSFFFSNIEFLSVEYFLVYISISSTIHEDSYYLNDKTSFLSNKSSTQYCEKI